MRNLTAFLAVLGCYLVGSSRTDCLSRSQPPAALGHRIEGAVPYRHFLIDVYEMSRPGYGAAQQKQYVYAPILELDHTSPVCYVNSVAGRVELAFRISFWTRSLQETVFDYVRSHISARVRKEDVSVVPFKAAMLSGVQSLPGLEFENLWHPYRRDQYVKFKMICQSLVRCRNVAKAMQSDPNQFPQLRVLLSSSSDKTKTLPVTITAASIRGGSLFTEISLRFPDKRVVLLTEEDATQLISESVRVIANQFIDDVSLVSPDSVIHNQIRNLIVHSMRGSQQASPIPWDSVYWRDEKYRPDKMAAALNALYDKSNKQTRQFILEDLLRNDRPHWTCQESFEKRLNEIQYHSPLQVNLTAWAIGDFELLDLLAESCAKIRWTGDRFEPRPVTLVAIRMSAVHGDDEFAQVSSYVSYTRADWSFDVVVDEHFQLPPSQLTPLYDQMANIKSHLTNLTTLLDISIKRQCPREIGDKSVCFDKTRSSFASCFCFVNILKNWSDASTFCRSRGMQLVSVETEEKNDFLRLMVRKVHQLFPKGETHYWSSGINTEPGGRWIWSAINQPVESQYSNWAKGRPKGVEGSILLYYDSTDGWYDQPKSWTRYFICEF